MINTKLRLNKTARKISKAELRRYAKRRRMENVNRDVKEELLIEHLYTALFDETEGVGTRRSFFIYLSVFLEAPTDKLIERLKADGHTVYCPRIENGEMKAVLHGEDFTLSELGIREPIGDVYEGDIDYIIAPLLAVDMQGNRLGYGGGYYDRFMKRSKALRVGYCYQFQIVNEVPMDAWDEKLQLIITDERIIKTE